MLSAVFFCGEGIGKSSDSKEVQLEYDREIENQKKIIEYFTNNILQNLTVEKGFKFTVHHIKRSMRRKPWIEDIMKKDIKECENLFLIDATWKKIKSKYFLCKQQSIIHMISSYKLLDNEWIKDNKGSKRGTDL